MATPNRTAACVLVLLLSASHVYAHGGHDRIPDGEGISPDPIDTILWLHILIQILSWGVLFPLGMVLGIIRSRWHIPVQVLGTAGAVVAYYLGHHHGGRQFNHNVHATFARYLQWGLFTQIILGAYLRLHIERGFMGKIRKGLVLTHGFIGKALPVAAWVQMLFGGIVAMGFCRGDHLGQCAAHFIMGSAFIAYGILLTILLLVGQAWLRRTGRSQEFFDSVVIAAWGCVNTFTEHRWGGPWVRNDLQHTTMGIIWWSAGLVGVWLSRKRDGRPKRNLVPGIVILMTGWAMSAHPQELMLSTMVHTIFGYSLMAAGATRIIEVAFVLKDRSTLSLDGYDPNSWQYLPPFLLIASGFIFMGATEEQMVVLSAAGVTHVAYILVLYSIAFLLFLFVNMLLHLYAVNMFPAHVPSTKRTDTLNPTRPRDYVDEDEEAARLSHANGNGTMNGSAANGLSKMGVTEAERRRMKDVQEFELDALISDDDDEEAGHGRRKEGQRHGEREGAVKL